MLSFFKQIFFELLQQGVTIFAESIFINMKVGPQSYRGIDFVRESDLPVNQQEALRKTPDSPERIKILINGTVVENCIYYKDYERWFHEVFCKQRELVAGNVQKEPVRQVVLSVSAG